MWHVGIDEAGRGPVLGPLVVGAVAIPTADLEMLIEHGVKDSKDLTHKKRVELVEWFHMQVKERGWKFSLIECKPERVDHGVQTTGLNLLEVELFSEALIEIRQQVKQPLTVLNDACDVNEQRFTDRIAARMPMWPWVDSSIHSEHKADSTYPIVGMASILAKVQRDLQIQRLAEEIGHPLGSGYPSDPNTKAALAKLLLDSTPHPALRWSWKTVSRAWMEIYGVEPPKRPLAEDNQKTLF
ncbi:MAG TPA: ribonuclease HII [Candidatus Poseidoniaceae archaeon]|nr:ribonuclease HII [Candidatus Poseidoniaceae archaeon]